MFSAVKQLGSSKAPASGPFGRFYLQEIINSGGMADIWLATDGKGKAFALRLMHERLRFNLMARRRFVQGCEILAKIGDHDGIIGYVEHGKIKGQLYLLMEYVEAENLKELYARHDPVLLEHVAQILIDMAVALEHMHENGFMHLDFKPENVLVTRNGSVRLVDFDLAQQIPEKPKKFSKKNPGTPAYMAPEQLQGQPISHRVDIFSYGVTAYELLTNQKPFPGDSPGEILSRQINRTEFLGPRQLNPDLPVPLEKVILRCLEQEPERRHPFIGVMVRELQAALYV
ncbi:MAG TPA: serine/threonine-protein kinase [Candidatus Limnocylindrales bacterium]|nr:serine/threonine-protein kinase [Candidatus Limnocylindrales bacterium]